MKYSIEKAIDAVRWLIKGKLHWSHDEVCQNLTFKTFRDNGLDSMFYTCFNRSTYAALDAAFPGEFKPWELRSVPRNFWNIETAAEAVRWLIEEKLHWSHDEVCQNLSIRTFKDNRLNSMLDICFNRSPYLAINAAYPEEFRPWELKSVPQNFWNIETATEAVRWLIGEKLRWSHNEVCQNLSIKTFEINRLSSVFRHYFNRSPYLAINAAYPGEFKPWELKNKPKNYLLKKIC